MSAVSGCTGCDEKGGIRKAGPEIEVKPYPIVLTDADVGATRELAIKVRNAGTTPLTFSSDPVVIDQTGVSIDFAVVNKFTKNCEGNPRPETADLKSLQSNECALIGLNYRANADGAFSAKLRFATNQTDLPEGNFDVPISGEAFTPSVKACIYDGDTEIGCSVDGQQFIINLTTTPIALGSTLTRTLKIVSDGSGQVKLDKYTQIGDVDFVITPDVNDFQPVTIAGNSSFDFNVDFTPVAGGPRETTLEFDTNDPLNPKLVVVLTASGDGPALCFCIGSEGSTLCKPMPTADFGTVPTGQVGRKFLRLASCGTQPLEFKKVEISNTDASPVFAGTDLPAAGTTLAPNAAALEPKLTFSPTQPKPYVGTTGGGRLVIETANQRAFIDLIGNAVEGGCKLKAATMTLDFGQGAKGIKSKRILALSNTGGEDCTFPTPATITAGAAIAFSIENAPTTALPAGQATSFELGYTPADTTGPDEGELTIPYGGAGATSPTGDLKIKLRGTPVAMPTCKLEVQPGGASQFGRTLMFGQVRINTTKVLPLSFKNVGSSACNVGNGRIVAGAFSAIIGATASAFKIVKQPSGPILPGDTATIDVSFTPNKEGDFGSPFSQIGIGGTSPYSVNVLANTSDTAYNGQDCSTVTLGGTATPGCVGWGLAGQGARSDIQVLPSDINFGLITVGCQSQELQVTVYNTGGAPVTVNAIRVDPPTPSGQTPVFTVVPGAVPFTLNGGGQRKITVRYRPPDANPHSATLYIESNATNGNIMTVPLRGEGTTESRQTDIFKQNTTPKTDLLFVIDNSGSMGEEQGLLASNAQTFITEADKLNSDYQIAVTTTDMSKEAGAFVGNPKIIKPSANAASQFAATVRSLGTNGDATEQGLQAMFAALSDPLINDPTKNGGFLRQDAKLAVVVVSDEDDYSAGSLNFFIDFLKNIKGITNAAMVSLSAIVGDSPSGCSSSNGDASSGERYLNVQAATGGKFRSICSGNWGQIAKELSLDVFVARSGFQLTRWAIASSIVVKVNGATAPVADWTYDPATNTVAFKATAIPPANADIVITYDTICY